MESLGEKLKKLREEKGMTLKDVSQATKIRVSNLSALENEDWNKLPQRIFIKGFVRAYVRAVDGDETPIMDLFEATCPVQHETISCPPYEKEPLVELETKEKKHRWLLPLLLSLILIAAIYFFIINSSKQDREKKVLRSETTFVTRPEPKTEEKTPPPSKPVKAIPSTPTTPQKDEKEQTPSVETNAEPTAENLASQQTSQPSEKTAISSSQGETTKPTAEPAAGSPSVETPSKENLVITAKMETWISVKIDGKFRKERLLKPGETFSVNVEKFAELLIGNAGGVDILFKGKRIENIGKPGQVVRLRLPRRGEEQN